MRVKMILAALAVTAAAFASSPAQARELGGIFCTNGGHPPSGAPGSADYQNGGLVGKVNYMAPHVYTKPGGGLFTCYWVPVPKSQGPPQG